MVLKTVVDKQMTELTIMSKKLAPPPNTSQVSKEARKVPDLETFTKALKDKHPAKSLPSVEICAQIRDVFSKLAAAHKAYAEAADGIAELSTELTPPHYTMMLTAAVMPTIQVVIPGNLVSPVTAPPLPQAAASTVLGKSEILKYMKLKVLPDPDSPELMAADKNSATHVLAVAIYLKVEHLFFDDTSSRMDIATAFRCNLSQLTKAVTGVNYKLTAKSPNLSAKIWYGLTVHIRFLILNLQAKFFKFTLCLLAKFLANYTNSVQFAPKNPMNNAKFAPFIHPLYFVFRCLTIGKELSEIPANQAEFPPFAHRFRE